MNKNCIMQSYLINNNFEIWLNNKKLYLILNI